VCVLVYVRTYSQITRLLDVSPSVGRTPGEPEESRLTKAQYTCRPYRCTQYICLYICWVDGQEYRTKHKTRSARNTGRKTSREDSIHIQHRLIDTGKQTRNVHEGDQGYYW